MTKSTTVVSPRRTIRWATSTILSVSAMCRLAYRSTGTPAPVRSVLVSSSVGMAAVKGFRDPVDRDAEGEQLSPSRVRPGLVDRVGHRRPGHVGPADVRGIHLSGLVELVLRPPDALIQRYWEEAAAPGKPVEAHQLGATRVRPVGSRRATHRIGSHRRFKDAGHIPRSGSPVGSPFKRCWTAMRSPSTDGLL